MKLTDLVSDYIELKRATGMKLRVGAWILREYCRAMGDVEIWEVKPHAVLSFISGAGPITSHWRQKHSTLKNFYRFAVTRGFAETSPLPTVLPKIPPPLTPYIYP